MTRPSALPDRERRLTIARTCTYFNVRRATRVLGDVFDEALRPHGLRGTQFSLLVTISLTPTPTVGVLAEVLAADRTTLTRTLAPLERDGLVASERGEDRRQRRLRLTPRGQARLAAAVPAWDRAQAWVMERLGADGERLLAGARAVAALTERPPGATPPDDEEEVGPTSNRPRP